MRYALSIPPFGDFANPRYLAQIAHEAEDLGWEGFFIWDHVFFDPSFHANVSPWVGLAACAMTTTTIKLGAMITPLARRRPWNVARETVSLDQLSNGRLIVGVGLGDPVQWDYGFFHEETDAKIRAKKLDEGLDILTGLWTGEPFSYTGEQFQLEPVTFKPTPVQTPRIPIWVGGNFPNHPPMRRAARYDGYLPIKWDGGMTPDDWRETMAYINPLRTSSAPMDWVHGGNSNGDDRAQAVDQVAPFIDVGVTWWIESIDPWRFDFSWEIQWTPEMTAKMLERIRQGPPKA